MRRALIVSILLSAALAFAAGYELPAKPGEVRYVLNHPFKRVVGVSLVAIGTAEYDPATGGKVTVRAPAKSFSSGNGSRDQHMLEVVNAHRHPDVVFEAVLPPGLAVPGETELDGTVTLAGTPAKVKVKVKATQGDGGVYVIASFTTSLSAHKIERPHLMFVKVDDALEAQANLLLKTK